ncbi:hypothetical protein ACDQ55_08815 [Chitinophaga sp. 30R24]|uniref:hypothetical protein n=1 Tax=Chitinophaga sp. 30R24 TaxID=3248838 RepID=UPI003B90E20C
MLAYNGQTLDNLEIREEMAKALRKNCIDATTFSTIAVAHPVDFYTPNTIIRIGLFILTGICVSFSLGFLTLITGGFTSTGNGISTVFIFTALLCVVILELFIRKKKFFQAGVDDALIWSAALLLGNSLLFSSTSSFILWSLIQLVVTALATLRYADRILAGLFWLAFLSLIFNIAVNTGMATRTIIPFLVIIFSFSAWYIVHLLMSNLRYRHYQPCLQVLSALTLLTAYLAGNYYVVRELGNKLFNLNLPEGQSIPGAWFFWIYTVAVPLVYIYFGILKKATILLRTGLLLTAAIVFTIRYYYSELPLDTAMIIGGAILITGAWALIRYLKTPRHGFTYQPDEEASIMDKVQIESLIIAQTFTPGSHMPQNNNDLHLGEGSGGGGGASGEF